MNETLLWLLYILGGAGAFALVRYRDWAITPSTLLPSGVGTALYPQAAARSDAPGANAEALAAPVPGGAR